MKTILRYILAVLLLAGCTDETAILESRFGGGSGPDSTAVAFNVLSQRMVTRAGVPGDLTNDSIRGENLKPVGTSDSWHHQAGFGVFAYYTGNGYFQPTSQPTFMYNQQVNFKPASGGVDAMWDYEPLKYWPNNFVGATAPEDDHVSFFAYAPYVKVDKATGTIVSTKGAASGDINNLAADGGNPDGITGIPYMGATGDPLIDSVVSTDLSRRVDLCWASAREDTEWGPTGSKVSVKAGMPWLNLTRAESVDKKVEFNFRHALAKLNVQIDAPADENQTVNTAETRVFVRQVSFTGFTLKGSLNLNNIVAGQPNWTGYQGMGWLSHDRVTFHDGRLDGQEGYLPNRSETPTGLNPEIVQHTFWDQPGVTNQGVTQQRLNLFTPSGSFVPTTIEGGSADPKDYEYLEPTYVIPTGDPVSVEIIYDVETKADLAGTLSDGRTPGMSTCTHALRENLLSELEPGKAYTMRLHLGLNSVKFDVAVANDWDVQPSVDVYPTPPRVGDALFSDGTWGNPQDYPEKTPVALVFSTETSDKDKALGYVNGYAIATDRISSGFAWATSGTTAAGRTPSSEFMTDSYGPFGVNGWDGSTYYNLSSSKAPSAELLADIDGLTHCRTAYANNGNSFDLMPAMKAANEYTGARPSKTSEWYLPSWGQIHKLYVNCGGLPEQHNWTNNGTNLWRKWISGSESTVRDFTNRMTNAINKYFREAGLDNYDKFTNGNSGYGGEEQLWTSTEVEPGCAWFWYTNNNTGAGRTGKTATSGVRYIRPVLAF